MYNRYIPQNDGSFRRHQAQDHAQKPEPPPSTPTPSPMKESPSVMSHQSAGGFLRNLLPKEFDTGDLIVVLLLLLMAGDSEQERNTALLTLALYFLL